MTPDKLKELRELLVYGNSGDHVRAVITLQNAIALIDAELAKPEACTWKRVPGSRMAIETCRSVHHGSPEKFCPDCGKRVEVES